ncbi:MAG: 16S rRNA (guanine(527)-N(7))-methyltransferase RsmG [Desulfobacterales bacterium]|nr:16S rRNA (guanine(527)-N(7))-methyltransferase RsmG [Desulfobacterales bacterium]MBF0396238.1 16S rRNA (guanine(527)-N(7))-methyltransferase RsmG [Desulfobacterales bacterium]
MNFNSKTWKSLIMDGAKSMDICLDLDMIDKFAIHAEELINWNKKINLTAIIDPFEIAVKHFLDSIIPISIIQKQGHILDIGSGGGFPGIPIKILKPSSSMLLIDASEKKVIFLKNLIRILNLKDISALHVRGEDLKFKKKFNVIISRALSTLFEFAKISLPLLSDHGMLVALKGNITKEEIDKLMTLDNGKFKIEIKEYNLPYIGDKRSIVIVSN